MELGLTEYLIKGGLSAVAAYFLWRFDRADRRADRFEKKLDAYGSAMLAHVEKLTNSISALNITVARYAERTESLDKRVTRLEDRKAI